MPRKMGVPGWAAVAAVIAALLLAAVPVLARQHHDAAASASVPVSSAATTAGSARLSTDGTCVASRLHPALSSGLLSYRYGETTRTYRLFVPARDDGRHALPVVFDFHGFKADGALEEQRSRMGVLGVARGFVVVTPDALGTPRRWNTPADPGKADDVGFVTALLGELASRYCLDAGRVYATGHSNGAEFAAALVCRSPLFAAVAMVSSTSDARCPAGRAPATMAVHGTADPSVPYNGGQVVGATVSVPAASAVIQDYAARYGCASAPVRYEPTPGVTAARYTGCAQGGDVLLDTVIGGTHLWPASPEARADPHTSTAGRTFDATGAILDFLAEHHAPTAPR
ncbi:PHB depolymerase family esterase [Frankia sp. AgB32]|uniref:alpha/beta hydrolase family esterase n=1 Tax=Frankia sp. AgB32 TaxID=631119 RepID=UPI00200D0C06|nr:PHB depolymerase family esterase [Frankia sp. AgB32]MCK9895598.1 plasmid partitioning protein [Frankia sp. AgB32]